ncbi:ATPase domain-containing protein [Thermococcus sp.]|uniref:RAD55 family ATPase n=1 Tax=Thermococcus sp. TaxID=35749 RepID=UPI002621838A|nr:ATPase domain-containing protein [Thermococcus sp.]
MNPVRVSTGIAGLDKMLNGGLIGGRVYLVKGSPGTGKTTLAMHFAMEGVKNGEDVLYITLEEPAENIREDFGRMGFDVRNPSFVLLDATPTVEKYVLVEDFFETYAKSLEKLTSAIVERFREIRYSRIIVDPITMLKVAANTEMDYRKSFLTFVKSMMKLKATVLITSELEKTDIEEYLVNGVIELKRMEVNGRLMRTVRITKFRGSGFDPFVRTFEITDRGMVINTDEEVGGLE